MTEAPAFLSSDDAAEPIDVAPRQRRCWLVEEQELRFLENGASDLKLLPDGQIEVANLCARIDEAETQFLEMCDRDLLGAPFADEAE